MQITKLKRGQRLPVLLVFTGKKQHMPTIPFSIMVLASYLRKKRVPVDILDTRVEDYTQINFNKYCLIGISAKTGEQLSSTIEVCEHIRTVSKTPIVWGGCHATFFPEQVCRSRFADYVVRKEGEETLNDLVRHIYGEKSLDDIKGLTYRITDKNGDIKIVSNPDRDFININKLELPAYDLLDLNKYQDSVGYLTYEATRGCPHRCRFCYVHKFHNRKWRFKETSKVVSELKEIKERFGITRIFLCDDNFFVRKEYVMKFCHDIINCGENFKFFSQARASYLSGYDDGEMELLKRAGFEFIAIGAESGSQKILDFIEKDISVRDIIVSAQRCTKYDIVPIYSFIIGSPTETKEDVIKTIECYFKLKKISPKVEINGFYIFTPYPGTPMYDEAMRLGYLPHTTLEGWGTWNFSDRSNIPWFSDSWKNALEVLSKIILFNFIKDRFNSYGKRFKKSKLGKWYIGLIWDILSPIMNANGLIRLKLKIFNLAFGWILFGKVANNYFKIT